MAIPTIDGTMLKERFSTIWEGFEVKDLTKEEFIRQMLELYDPKKMMDDLGDIELKKGRERLNKIRIDNARKNG
ncbi:hypothetical protein LCGC14_2695460 [marine sediment metagenome]|uniref:Uncharacterized protein n=1 Tax=marine sediment metagenome TaxID=412755 RepID=A0A0F9C909_9ZZZZ